MTEGLAALRALATMHAALNALFLLPLSKIMPAYMCASLQEEVDEFFDAKSLLGSLQQAFSSAMASSYQSTGGGASACVGGGSSTALWGAGADDVDIFAMHDLAASIREVRRCHCIGGLIDVLSACSSATSWLPRWWPLAPEALLLPLLSAAAPADGGRAGQRVDRITLHPLPHPLSDVFRGGRLGNWRQQWAALCAPIGD